MGKYLNEVEISPCNFYERSKANKVAEETRGLLYAINSHFKRNVSCRFGKVVIVLWPEGKLSDAPRPIPRYEYDTMSNVAMINLEYDIDQYVQAPNISDRNLLMYDILKEVFSALPEEFGLDGCVVIKVLDEVREAGFVFTKLAGRKVRSPSKKVGAILRYVFDYTGQHISALITTKDESGEIEIPIASYTIYEYANILSAPAKLVFIDENTLEFQPKDCHYQKVRVTLPD